MIKKFANQYSFFLVFLSIYVVLLILRSPDLFVHGRLFAEGGSRFFNFSLINNSFDSIFYLPGMQGYYLLNTNLVYTMSKFLPLRYVGLFIFYSSLVIMLLPSTLFYIKSKILITNPTERAVISFILFLLPSQNFHETFANSINAQIYLSLSLLILLIFDSDNFNSFTTAMFVGLCLLSGIYSLIYLPIILFKIFTNNFTEQFRFKYKYFKSPTFIVSISSLSIQFAVIIYTKFNNYLWPNKLSEVPTQESITSIIYASFYSNIPWFIEILIKETVYLNTIIFLSIMFLIFNTKLSLKINLVFLFSYVLVLFLISFGKASSGLDQRYQVAISFILFTCIILNFQSLNKKIKLPIYFLVLSTFLASFYFQIINKDNAYFLNVEDEKYLFKNQVDNLNNENSILYHYPIGQEGSVWLTNFKNINTELADFQKVSNMKLDNDLLLYEIILNFLTPDSVLGKLLD